MKTHLTASKIPLEEGRTVPSLCGETIPNSVWMFRFICGSDGEDFFSSSTLLLCKKCVELALGDSPLIEPFSTTYLYGVQNREEMKDSLIRKLGVVEESA